MSDEEVVVTPLTLEELYSVTEDTVALPLLSARLGKPRTVRFCSITRNEWIAEYADAPPGSETWGEKEWKSREEAWLKSLPPEERRAYNHAWADTGARVCALAALEPKLTVATAKRLGEDMLVLYNAILRFSGLMKEPAAVADVSPQETPAEAEPLAP